MSDTTVPQIPEQARPEHTAPLSNELLRFSDDQFVGLWARTMPEDRAISGSGVKRILADHERSLLLGSDAHIERREVLARSTDPDHQSRFDYMLVGGDVIYGYHIFINEYGMEVQGDGVGMQLDKFQLDLFAGDEIATVISGISVARGDKNTNQHAADLVSLIPEARQAVERHPAQPLKPKPLARDVLKRLIRH